jgi:L-threonylcarbamoyladenylate synthase
MDSVQLSITKAAVRQVYVAKGRPSDNPLIVTVCSPEMVWKYAVKSELAEKLMATFWPGPLTIILPLQPNTLSSVVTGGLNTAAFRMPKKRCDTRADQGNGDTDCWAVCQYFW